MDTGDLIENNLAQFFHILRHLGVRVSSAETVDALRALFAVDVLDPRQAEAAFLATLAKTPDDRVIVQKAFRSFFVPPESKAERAEKYKQIREQEAREVAAAEKELKYELDAAGDEHKEVNVPLTEEEKKLYSKLPEDKKEKIRRYLQKQFQGNPVTNPEELINTMIKSSLNYWKYYLKMEDEGPPEVEYTGNEETDEVLREVAEQLRNEEQLLYEDIQNIAETDMPTAAAVIAKLSRRLATRISRRYQRSKKRERLDLRRTIRQNIRYGGTMFNLKYRTKKINKPRMLLICDVSGSMAKYASFVLQFMYGLANVTEEIESFIFSEKVQLITQEFLKPQPFEKTMTDIINLSEDWGKGTDFNEALRVINEEYKGLISKDTFVIILSDTKSLNAEMAATRLMDMKKRVKDIIWLNTLPIKVWPETRSVVMFRRHCRMLECSTLAHLDKIMRTEMLK